ncbi:hypothetical protein L0F63_004483 [Massospora cicadina]|nr:hypothetical protein L0F63_004483 [Massospora cicadina]
MLTFERSCDNCRRLKIRCDRAKPCCKNCTKRDAAPSPGLLLSPEVVNEDEPEEYTDYLEDSTTTSGGDSFSETEIYEESCSYNPDSDAKFDFPFLRSSSLASMYCHADADSRIDAPQAVSTTIKDDLSRFERELHKMVPNSLSEQQAAHLGYYFKHVQPQLPLLSSQRFLTLASAFPDDEAFQNSLKLLVVALCQSNLDVMYISEAALNKLPQILSTALFVLIRHHLAATSL